MADLRDKYGNVVLRIEGDRINDTYGNRLYEIRGEEIFDSYGNRLYQIRGKDLHDTYGNRLGAMDDLAELLKPEAASAGSPINTSSSSDSCENSPQYESKAVSSGSSVDNIVNMFASSVNSSTLENFAKAFKESERNNREREREREEKEKQQREEKYIRDRPKNRRNNIRLFFSVFFMILAIVCVNIVDSSILASLLLCIPFIIISNSRKIIVKLIFIVIYILLGIIHIYSTINAGYYDTLELMLAVGFPFFSLTASIIACFYEDVDKN